MSNSRTSSAFQGAAAGAAAGSRTGNWWGVAIGAVAGGAIGYFSGSSIDSQRANQQAWARYNSSLQLNADLYNLSAQLSVARYNAQAAQYQAAFQARQQHEAINYNINLINTKTAYESQLFDDEIQKTWNAYDLDVQNIHMFRARELGSLVADQAASGTVIGEGSNAQIVIDQQTQEALDVSIAKFDADRTVADIENARARSQWEAGVAIQQMLWQGAAAEAGAAVNASLQAAGGASAALLNAGAGRYDALQHSYMRGIAMQMGAYRYSAENNAAITRSLFSLAGTGVSHYYGNKTPDDGGAGSSLLNG